MIVADFSFGWIILIIFSAAIFAVFSYLRKSISGSVRTGLIGLALAVVTELIGVNMNLWNYTPGNWPILLWPTYFIFTMALYQISKFIDKK